MTTQEDATTEGTVNSIHRVAVGALDKPMSDASDKEEDLARKNIIKEELKETDKGKYIKDENIISSTDEKGPKSSGGSTK